jgi:hypothetical protein
MLLLSILCFPSIAARATSTVDLITCKNLSKKTERITSTGRCTSKEALSKWHATQGYPKLNPELDYLRISVCTSKNPSSVKYQLIRKNCGNYQKRTDYIRINLAPSTPSIERVSILGANSVSITLSDNAISNPDSPISYFMVFPKAGAPISIHKWSGSTFTVSGLVAETKYSFRVRAVSADGASEISSESEEVTTNKISSESEEVSTKTSPPVRATEITVSSTPSASINLISFDSASVTIPVGVAQLSLVANPLGNLKMSFPAQSSQITGFIGSAMNPVGSGSTPFSAVGTPIILDISLTGFSETSTICLDGDSNSRLWQFISGVWVDITLSHSSGQVCGSSSALGIFASAALPAVPVFNLSSSAETKTVSSGLVTGYSLSSTGGAIASYAISPAISNTPGLSFDTSTGLITGTPTQIAIARIYTITATNADGSSSRTFTITVVPVAPNFSLSSNAEIKSTGSAIAGYTIRSTGGSVVSYSINPAISNTPGLSFDSTTGLISGTPTQSAVERIYTITGTNAGGSSSAIFAITVVPLAPAFAFTSLSETITVGAAMTGYAITSSGGPASSYSISPDIANTPGLTFNTATGLISGTPSQIATAITYSVTGTNVSGSASATFTVTVVPVAPAFTFSVVSETITVSAGPISGYTLTSTGGLAANYTISPAISNTPGLAFDTSTGLISGTPTQSAAARTYSVTGTNAGGSYSRTFTITVVPNIPSFTISSTAETITASSGAISGYTITSTGGAIASYSISPAISNTPGLSFSTSTGLISGTPTAAADARTYTITGTNAGGSSTRTFTVRVLPAVYTVGQTGPGGGKVFYASLTAFTMTGAPCGSDCHYLEWAPSSWASSDYSNKKFGASSDFYGGGTGSALGTGYSNTVLLATANAGTGWTVTAADVPVYVRAYLGGGLSDWFLPSWDETLLMSNSSEYSSGGFASDYYWSSTANSAGPGTSVQLHYMNSKTNNDPGLQPIYRNFPVRPIRAG